MAATRKVVQTELDPALYEFVLRTAKAKGLTLKEAAREALRRWASSEGDLSWDPLFDLSKTYRARGRTDSSRVDEVLYGKAGPRAGTARGSLECPERPAAARGLPSAPRRPSLRLR